MVLTGIEPLDDLIVFFGNEAAADLAGAGQLAVVGVEFLVQQHEAIDLRCCEVCVLGQIGVHLLDIALDEIVDFLVRRQFLIAGIGNPISLSPISHRLEVDADQRRDIFALVAEGDRLLDEGEELQLVLDEFGREHRAVLHAANILGPVDDPQMAVVVDEARVAGMHEPVGRLGLFGRLVVLVVLLENAGAAEQQLAVLGEFDIDPLDGDADSIRAYIAIELDGDEPT